MKQQQASSRYGRMGESPVSEKSVEYEEISRLLGTRLIGMDGASTVEECRRGGGRAKRKINEKRENQEQSRWEEN